MAYSDVQRDLAQANVADDRDSASAMSELTRIMNRLERVASRAECLHSKMTTIEDVVLGTSFSSPDTVNKPPVGGAVGIIMGRLDVIEATLDDTDRFLNRFF